MISFPIGRPRACALATSMLAALVMAWFPLAARAEFRVAGSPDAVEIEAHNASIEEVLNALCDAFDLRYRTSADLGRSVSGSYSGSLRHVISRILNSYDFTMETSPDGMTVTVYGPGGERPKTAGFTFGAVQAPGGISLSPPQLAGDGRRNSSDRRSPAQRRKPPVE